MRRAHELRTGAKAAAAKDAALPGTQPCKGLSRLANICKLMGSLMPKPSLQRIRHHMHQARLAARELGQSLALPFTAQDVDTIHTCFEMTGDRDFRTGCCR